MVPPLPILNIEVRQAPKSRALSVDRRQSNRHWLILIFQLYKHIMRVRFFLLVLHKKQGFSTVKWFQWQGFKKEKKPPQNKKPQNLIRIMVCLAEKERSPFYVLPFPRFRQGILSPLQFTTQLVIYILYCTTKYNRTVNAPLMLRGTGGKKSHQNTHIHVPKTLSQLLFFLFHTEGERTRPQNLPNPH